VHIRDLRKSGFLLLIFLLEKEKYEQNFVRGKMMSNQPIEFSRTDRLEIPVSHGKLEARFEEPEGPMAGAALLCHPHPQYGGNMNTKALHHLARAYNEEGLATLRFNFRGIGASTGSYDGGDGERDDARAALDELRSQVVELDVPLVCGGFSFGAAVGLRVGFASEDVDGLVGIGLPVSLSDFEYLREDDRPLLVIQGEKDSFGPPERVQEVLDVGRDNVSFHVMKDAEHLFTGYFEELRETVKNHEIG
jgi:alpha/beta superfamily hydrolase